MRDVWRGENHKEEKGGQWEQRIVSWENGKGREGGREKKEERKKEVRRERGRERRLLYNE